MDHSAISMIKQGGKNNAKDTGRKKGTAFPEFAGGGDYDFCRLAEYHSDNQRI